MNTFSLKYAKYYNAKKIVLPLTLGCYTKRRRYWTPPPPPSPLPSPPINGAHTNHNFLQVCCHAWQVLWLPILVSPATLGKSRGCHFLSQDCHALEVHRLPCLASPDSFSRDGQSAPIWSRLKFDPQSFEAQAPALSRKN